MPSVVSTIFFSSDPNELCYRLILLLQEQHAGSISNLIDAEIVAIVYKILQYKCISVKQQKQILIKCNLLSCLCKFLNNCDYIIVFVQM